MNTSFRRGPVSANRSGFTLVELLAVIVIIGTLVGLILPAVQVAREAGRFASCLNNLKQMGQAVQSYADANKRFPAGRGQLGFRGADTQSTSEVWLEYGFAVVILPFLEEQTRYTNIVSWANDLANGASTASRAAGNNPHINESNGSKPAAISTFLCPSDPAVIPQQNRRPYLVLNYSGNWGDVLIDHNYSPGSDRAPMRGVFVNMRHTSASQRSIRPVTFNRISDGLSKTVLLGEVAVANGAQGPRFGVKTGVANWIGTNDDQPSPSTCASAAESWVALSAFTSNNGRGHGINWGLPDVGITGFFTIQPPNSVLCRSTNDYRSYSSVSSYHPGGAAVVMCDGATRFVTEDIDCGDQTVKPARPSGTSCREYVGPSLWGVWGAMGTTYGGEAISP